MPTEQKTPISVVHIAGVLLIIACTSLAFTIFKGQPEIQVILVGAATGLYGKLGFKPMESVLDGILSKIKPAKVASMAQMSAGIIDVINIVEAAKKDPARTAEQPVVVAVPVSDHTARAQSIPPAAVTVPLTFEAHEGEASG